MVETARLTDNSLRYLDCLDKVAQPLIREGVYASEEEFLRDNVRYMARRQIEECQQVIRGFEKQYISWEKFSDALLNVATPAQEDAWMEWESERRILAAWQKLLRELG